MYSSYLLIKALVKRLEEHSVIVVVLLRERHKLGADALLSIYNTTNSSAVALTLNLSAID